MSKFHLSLAYVATFSHIFFSGRVDIKSHTHIHTSHMYFTKAYLLASLHFETGLFQNQKYNKN